MSISDAERPEQILFNETPSRIVISSVPENAEAVLRLCQARKVPAHRIGAVGGDQLDIALAGNDIRSPIAEIHRDWFNAIANVVGKELTTS